jgi:uncharacterized NAD(P)/FAD-binding protein YdhS
MSAPAFQDALQSFDLAIVGAGPAGLACAMAAARFAPHWRVLWLRGAKAPFSPAFVSPSLRHRLNVPVERMGIEADDPAGFLRWLQEQRLDLQVGLGEFVPRCWFGDYLAWHARGLPPSVQVLDGAINDLRPQQGGNGWQLHFGTQTCASQRVVLSLGMPGPECAAQVESAWVRDPWAWWQALPDAWVPPSADEEILVVGSGLTAVDMVLGLRERGFAGRIRVVSTAGEWSHAHAATTPLSEDVREHFEARLAEVETARDLVDLLRTFAAQHPWRAVVDALRPHTNAVWGELPPQEQRRVLRHAFGVWNRHRHRMAPDVRATLDADTALRIEAGRIRLGAEGRIERHHHGQVEVLRPVLALDCRGPGFRTALAGDTLLAQLVRAGTLKAHPHGTGVCAPRDSGLAVIGAALFGERFESVAVPELRQQAVEVVRRWSGANQR